MEEERLLCGGSNNLQVNHNIDSKLKKIQKLPNYHMLRQDIFSNLVNFSDKKSAERVQTYMKEKLPCYIPNGMYANQIKNEKCMYMFMEMFRFFKFMNAFVVMRALSKDLSQPFTILKPSDINESRAKSEGGYKLDLIQLMYETHIKPYQDKWNAINRPNTKNTGKPNMLKMHGIPNQSQNVDFAMFGNTEHFSAKNHSNPSAFGFGFGGL